MSARKPCTQCGRSHRATADLCSTCKPAAGWSKEWNGEIALTGGHWATRPGGLRVWIGERPDDEPDPQPLEINHPRNRNIRPLVVPGRPVCGCGCLLAYVGEDCPSCRYALVGVAA
jgi:hypothetical protein